MRKRFTIYALLMTGLMITTLPVQRAAAQAEEIPLGTKMPAMDVSLVDVSGASARLGSLGGAKGTVVVFWSNECPWAGKYEDRLFGIANEFAGQGFSFLLLNPNDPVAFPGESVEAGQKWLAGRTGVRYFADASGSVAKAFGASRAPSVFVFDADEVLVYVGTIDDSPGDPGNVKKQYLREAMSGVAGGGDIPVPKTKAFGCTIKF